MRSIWTTLAGAVVLWAVTGCVNLQPKVDPTQFYVLNVPVTESSEAESEKALPAVGIRTLRLTDYLSRPEIMIRHGDSRIERQSAHRWAGDLGVNVQNELMRWWTSRQPQRALYFPPWESHLVQAHELRWRVSKLEGHIDAQGQALAVVAMDWSWKTGQVSVPHTIHREWTASWDGTDYASLVAILGQLLVQGYEQILESEPAE